MSCLALGCMRLSTAPSRDDAAAIAVVHTALDGGVRLLDTADAYCHDEHDVGHNERLVARALASWSGDRAAVRVATKGGLVRPGGKWVPDGRAKHLHAACEASLRALGCERIALYQLHAPDPRTPFVTSLRALARLQQGGLIERIGLCNVTLAQLELARTELEVASVQIALSPFDDDALRGGVVERCVADGTQVLAYRPLGGVKGAAKLARDAELLALAERHGCTSAELVLAWLRSLATTIVPLPGATRRETARACGSQIAIDDETRAVLDRRFPAADLLRRSQAERRPADSTGSEVVVLMGIPGAGKTTIAERLVDEGYVRLNRDREGGTLDRIAARLDTELAGGARRVVLDNTYPSRSDRNRVVETAWRHGVPVRCIWLDTPLEDARINAVLRMLARHGRLLAPEEIARVSRSDPNSFGPRAQHEHARTLEPPRLDEGFTEIEHIAFARATEPSRGHVLWLVDIDRVIDHPALTRTLQRLHDGGARLVAWAWRPARPDASREQEALTLRLGVPIDLRTCSHPGGPPVCWCRPPLPGLVLAAIHEHGSTPGEARMLGLDVTGERFAAACRIAFVHLDAC